MRTASRQIDHDLPESLDRVFNEAAALRAAAAKLEAQILSDIITRVMTAAAAAVAPQDCAAMAPPPPPPPPPPAIREKGDGLMSVPEAAEYLSCTPAALRKWILQRRIEPVKLGRLVRVRRQAIAAIAKHGLPNRK